MEDEQDLETLRVDVENGTDRDIDVMLQVAAGGLLGETSSRDLDGVTVPAQGSIAVTIPVTDVPLQSSSGAVGVMLVASYQTLQGAPAQQATPTLYLTFRQDYRAATVRSLEAQSRRRIPASSAPERQRGRKFDRDSGAMVLLNERIPTTGPAAAAIVTRTDFGLLDESEPVVMPYDGRKVVEPRAVVQKAGNYKFCARWQYSFRDQDPTEDFLKHYNFLPYGGIEAKRTWFNFRNLASSDRIIASGYMDANGCTPTLALSAGSYRFRITPAVGKDDTFIWAFPDHNEDNLWWQTDMILSGLGTTTRWFDYGWGHPVAAAAAVMSHMIEQPDHGLLARTYRVRAQERCPCWDGTFGSTCSCPPGVPSPCPQYQRIEACYDKTSDAVYIEKDNFGNWLTLSKYVTAHEIGHAVGFHLYGELKREYTHQASEPLCRCDHVTSANALHCIQSSEFAWDAQTEGWAQFYAADLMNRGDEANCSFLYYKEFLWIFGIVFPPPVYIDCALAYQWKEEFCPEVSMGTELDWMTFYREVNNRGGSNNFTYADLSNLYVNACGGSCTLSNGVTWQNLAASVNVLHPGSAKRDFWIEMGTVHGIDN